MLPDSTNPNDCNCQQCKELRVYEQVKEYFSDSTNLLSLTVREFFTKFPEVKNIRPMSIAATLLSKDIVICKDGFVRPNFPVFK